MLFRSQRVPEPRSDEPPPAEELLKSEYRSLNLPAAPAAVEQKSEAEARQSEEPGVARRVRAAPMTDSDVLMEAAGVAPTAELNDSAATLCPADDVAAPDTWLECIAKLEAEGRADEAARERRRFDLKYPNYDVD